jgi:hypothetical protein
MVPRVKECRQVVEKHVPVQVGSGQGVWVDAIAEISRLPEHTRSPFVDSESPVESGATSPSPVRCVESVGLGCGASGPNVPLSATRRGCFALGDETRHDGATDLVKRDEAVVWGPVGFLDKVRRACKSTGSVSVSDSEVGADATHAKGEKAGPCPAKQQQRVA